jgi:L-lactate dehydrogenase complex protein LldG
MESRNSILAALRAARGEEIAEKAPDFVAAEVFSDYPHDVNREKLFEQFCSRLLPLKGEVYRVAAITDAAQVVQNLCRESGYASCVYVGDPLVDAVVGKVAQAGTFTSSHRLADEECEHRILEGVAIGFTPVDALMSRTGSVVLRSTTAGGRRSSVLPPVHCVLAYEAQLEASLGSWLKRIENDRSWSLATIVTGPSRTADIEKILVLGAHGPKRLVVVVVQSEET